MRLAYCTSQRLRRSQGLHGRHRGGRGQAVGTTIKASGNGDTTRPRTPSFASHPSQVAKRRHGRDTHLLGPCKRENQRSCLMVDRSNAFIVERPWTSISAIQTADPHPSLVQRCTPLLDLCRKRENKPRRSGIKVAVLERSFVNYSEQVERAEAYMQSVPMLSISERSLPRLSNELISHIVGNLSNDSASLRACALTCHVFLANARTHLFRSVSLHLKNADRFLKLVEASPNVGQRVRSLHLTVSALEQRRNWVDRLLPTLAEHMPHVEELYLQGKGLYRATPLLAVQSIRVLYVCGCEIETLNDFCVLLGAFPRLEEVITDEMFVYRSAEIAAKPTVPSRKLKRLEFNSSRIDPVMLVDWMCQERINEALEYLTCCPIQHIAIAPMAKLLGGTGPALKRLKVALVGLVAQGGFVELLEQYMPLSQSPGLRHLEFGSPAAYANLYGADDKSFSWFPALLSQVVAPLQTVEFYLWEGDAEGLCAPVWNEIVYLLLSKFKSLERVEVHVWGNPSETAEIRKKAKELLMEFNEKGILYMDEMVDSACA